MEVESSYRVQNELRKKETGHKEAGNNTGKAGSESLKETRGGFEGSC